MDPSSLAISTLAVAAVFLFALSAYRLVSHPLHTLPGPALAAVTGWYRAYYDLVENGGMVAQINLLHERYGKIVRIGPNEIHFSIPAAYDVIYRSSCFIKDPGLYRAFPGRKALFTLSHRSAAKARKELLSTFFSRRAILASESLIKSSVSKLCSDLANLGHNDKPVDLYAGFRALTIDVTHAFCFGSSLGALDAPQFHHPILLGMEVSTPDNWVFKHFPYIPIVISKLPFFLYPYVLDRNMAAFHKTMYEKAVEITEGKYSDITSIAHSAFQASCEAGCPLDAETIFHEVGTMLFAGVDTNANALAVGFWHILRNEDIKSKLEAEVMDAWPDVRNMPFDYGDLEKLPYLTGVVKESLRCSSGVICPLSRIATEPVEICGIHVPAGSSVSISSLYVHNDESVFPDPAVFSPERWVNSSKEQENSLVPFSKGSRQCLGKSLALVELYTVFAHTFRRLEITAHDLRDDDLIWRDYFVPKYKRPHYTALVKLRR